MKITILNNNGLLIEAESVAEESALRLIGDQPVFAQFDPMRYFSSKYGSLNIQVDFSKKLTPQTVTRHEVYEITKEVAKEEIRKYMMQCLYGGNYFVNGGK